MMEDFHLVFAGMCAFFDGIMKKADVAVLFAGLRAFFDVPAKLWVDFLAAVVPHPLAWEVHRAVDIFHEDFRVFLIFLRAFLIFLGAFLVWRELRRR